MKSHRWMAVGLVALLSGCAFSRVPVSREDVVPTTFQPKARALARSVGLLRRLVILPLRLEVSPKNQRLCTDPCDWEPLRWGLASELLAYLVEARGYDAVSLDPRAESATDAGFTLEELEAMAEQLSAFARQRSEETPPEIVALLKGIAARTAADGVVVVHGAATALTWIDMVAMFPSFTFSLPFSLLRAGVSLEADVFEVNRGHLVWVSTHRSGPFHTNSSAAFEIVRRLLDPIEPALPAVMAIETGPPQMISSPPANASPDQPLQ